MQNFYSVPFHDRNIQVCMHFLLHANCRHVSFYRDHSVNFKVPKIPLKLNELKIMIHNHVCKIWKFQYILLNFWSKEKLKPKLKKKWSKNLN